MNIWVLIFNVFLRGIREKISITSPKKNLYRNTQKNILNLHIIINIV